MPGFFRGRGAPRYGGCAKQVGFIVGTGRCGTTVLSQVLNSHSRICVPHELQFILGIGNGTRLYERYVRGEMRRFSARDFIRLVGKCCTYRFDRYFDYRRHFKQLRYPQEDIRKVLMDLFDHICHEQGKEVICEQTPWYGQRLDVLEGIFPGMRVIHVIRDGRDVALSFARTPWWSNDAGENLLQWEREIRRIRAFGKQRPESYREVRYEDLVADPELELRPILDLFGMEFEAAMLDPARLIDYYALSKDIPEDSQSKEFDRWYRSRDRIFFPESCYAWKRTPDTDLRARAVRIAETLEEFGYET